MEEIRLSLAAARVNAKMSQKEAAKRLEINVATLRSYEKGLTFPNWSVIKRMESVYGIPMDYFDLSTDSL